MLHKLGKRPPVLDSRTLQFGKYVRRALDVPPPTESWIRKVPSWPMFLNDELGTCVPATMAHMIQQWTYYATNGAGMVTLSNADVLKAYSDIGGYVPGKPWTDNGCDMLTALKYWRKHGMAGHKILAFVSVDPNNIVEVQQAVWLFGNLFTGLGLPVSAQNPVEPGKWTVPPRGLTGDGEPWSWGGHCVPIMASSAFMHPLVTWGQTWTMTRNFRTAYCDELFAVLSREWIANSGLAPNQFDISQLTADLVAL